MAVLETAGLVRSSDTVAATPGILGPGAPRRVKRYEPSEGGQQISSAGPWRSSARAQASAMEIGRLIRL